MRDDWRRQLHRLGLTHGLAVAPGRIIVSESTKLIQPLEVSVVRRVLV